MNEQQRQPMKFDLDGKTKRSKKSGMSRELRNLCQSWSHSMSHLNLYIYRSPHGHSCRTCLPVAYWLGKCSRAWHRSHHTLSRYTQPEQRNQKSCCKDLPQRLHTFLRGKRYQPIDRNCLCWCNWTPEFLLLRVPRLVFLLEN